MKKVTKIGAVETPKKCRKLKVAAYCRVSTDNDAQLESLSSQRAHYESYINARSDWEYAGVYYDEGVTGTKKEKRPELLRLLADCESHKVDMIVTKSISRFARNTADCLETVRKLHTIHVPVYFESENINTESMESELLLSILSGMAEGESKSISENSKWAVKKRFQDGTFKIAYPPYGYDWDGEQMVVNAAQAEVVKRIFASTLSGMGTSAIAKMLNAEGVLTKKDGHWNPSSVRAILANEKYTGDVLFQKTYTDSSFNRHVNTGELDQYLVENHHEALVSREDFDAANKLVSQRGKEKGNTKGRKYLNRYPFSGLIACGECGDTFKRRTHSCKDGSYTAWACGTHIEDKSRCSMLYVREEAIKAAFATMMNKLIFSKDFLLLPYAQSMQESDPERSEERIQELNRSLLQIKERLEILTSLMRQGFLDMAIYEIEKADLAQEEAEARSTLKRLSGSQTKEMWEAQKASALLRYVDNHPPFTEYEEDAFTRFVEHIVIHSRTCVEFHLKCGLSLKERM